jgi:hypothetical protein
MHFVHRIKHNLNPTWFSRNIEIKQEGCTVRALLWLATARPVGQAGSMQWIKHALNMWTCTSPAVSSAAVPSRRGWYFRFLKTELQGRTAPPSVFPLLSTDCGDGMAGWARGVVAGMTSATGLGWGRGGAPMLRFLWSLDEWDLEALGNSGGLRRCVGVVWGNGV